MIKFQRRDKLPVVQGSRREAIPTASSPYSAKGCTLAQSRTCRRSERERGNISVRRKCYNILFDAWESGASRKDSQSIDQGK